MLTSTSSAIATSRRRITSTVTGSDAASASRGAAASLAAVNVDLLELADREAVARADQGARSVFLDQRRAAPSESGRQSVAVMDGGVEEAVFFQKEDRPPPRRRMGAALHFVAARRGGARVAGMVEQAGQLRPHHLQGRERMLLPLVADLGLALETDVAVA